MLLDLKENERIWNIIFRLFINMVQFTYEYTSLKEY